MTCQNDETGLSSCWLSCFFLCLELLHNAYDKHAKPQTPSSMREKSMYKAVSASVKPSDSPRNWTSSWLTGLMVGSVSREGQERAVRAVVLTHLLHPHALEQAQAGSLGSRGYIFLRSAQ